MDPVTAGNGSVVVVRGRDGVRQVFTDNTAFHRAAGLFDLPPGRPWSGMFDAVITASGAEHTRRRKLLMPAMHRTAMAHHREVFADTFARSRFAAPGGDPFDLKQECLRISKTNLMRCLLGFDDAASLGPFAAGAEGGAALHGTAARAPRSARVPVTAGLPAAALARGGAGAPGSTSSSRSASARAAAWAPSSPTCRSARRCR
ncbi:hypothetical protein [Dactylosporangium sp. NPDC006015]|uniref:hypothetical protein n=1 Tax=Dactylosporangium sp. NPDC006015 TaxID=3154576 RepID=UPI0033B077D2